MGKPLMDNMERKRHHLSNRQNKLRNPHSRPKAQQPNKLMSRKLPRRRAVLHRQQQRFLSTPAAVVMLRNASVRKHRHHPRYPFQQHRCPKLLKRLWKRRFLRRKRSIQRNFHHWNIPSCKKLARVAAVAAIPATLQVLLARPTALHCLRQ
jgi:hypothetical protein